MELNFKKLGDLAQQFQDEHVSDGAWKAYTEGRYVYSLHFEPSKGTVDVHIQWPMFRDMVASGQLTLTGRSVCAGVLHLKARLDNVTCGACLFRQEMLDEFMSLNMPKEYLEQFRDDYITDLFTQWQRITGWGLEGYHKEGSTDNG